jgi:hypothetical protein
MAVGGAGGCGCGEDGMSAEAKTDVGRSRVGIWALRLALVVVGVVVLTVAFNRKTVVVGLNTPIRYDDFAFLALDGKRGDPPTTYLVKLRVQNRARRVDFRFTPGMAVLVDGSGHAYLPAAGFDEVVLKAGSSADVDLRYDVPADLRSPTLRILPGGMIGDAIETTLAGRKSIRLP